jgi:hypothetical protein
MGIIFCAKNCERTIDNARLTTITIVVDGFSTDSTAKITKEAGATSVIQQPERKFPGRAWP